LQEIPVIFVTASTDVEDLAHGFEVGAVDYVTKPVKQPEVRARVATHLRLSRLVREQRSHLQQIEQARRELQELNDTKDKFMSNLGREAAASVARIGDYRASNEVHAPRSPDDVLRLLGTIMEWPRLQSGQKLDLFNTEVKDDDLSFLLQSLDNLRFLSLAATRISDAGLTYLKPLKYLQELHLDNTGITNNGLKISASMPNLRILDLKDTQITDEGLAILKPLSGLRGLYLTRTGITDAGLVHAEAFNLLETLILWDTMISDQGLTHLRSLHNLRELILWGTRVTEDGVNTLRMALPECDISTSMLT